MTDLSRTEPAEGREEPRRLNALGNALLARGETAGAVGCYRAALGLAPELAELHYNLANALAVDDPAAALAGFDRALGLDPGLGGAWNNSGNLLRRAGRPAEAMERYRRAVFLAPGDATLRTNVGAALLDQHRAEEALVWFAQAAQGVGADPGALAYAGQALLRLGRPEAALPWFEAALAADAADVPARTGRAAALLTLGDYAQGWRDFEARLADPRIAAGLPQGWIWDGVSPVAGRTVLLSGEQGHGDVIQFARYAPLLRARGARVVLRVPAGLVRLLGGLADAVIALEAPLPAFDLHCPLMSLPHRFGTTLATVPDKVPYLAAEAARLGGGGRGLRVGLAWSGNPAHMLDALRSIPAAALGPLLGVAGVEVHVLQPALRAGDAALAELPGLHRGGAVDFADTAARVAAMDLVISVDSAVAHLAGAMGRPTWVLLPYAADFRWLRGREDSPWYPTMRLFRQAAAGDWGAVIGAVAGALAAWLVVSRARSVEASCRGDGGA